MRFDFMLGRDINDRDFIELLGALPDPPAVTRGNILGAFQVLVAGDDPVWWWQSLAQDRGDEGAAKAVAQLVIAKGGKRVLDLIRAEAAGWSIEPRADDSKLVRLLFDGAMEDQLYDQDELRSIVCEYYEETHIELDDDDPDLPEPEDEFDQGGAEEKDEDAVDGPSIIGLFSGKPRPSAQRGAKWALERVQHPPGGFLDVPDRWKERDLEELVWAEWESIDFAAPVPGSHLTEGERE